MTKHYVSVECIQLAGREAYKVWTIAESAAEAASIQAMLVDRKPARAFVGAEFPNPPAGYDPLDREDEPWPSDATATTYPPPCDGNNAAGDLLARAQHEAAEGGGDCTGTACLLTRGAND